MEESDDDSGANFICILLLDIGRAGWALQDRAEAEGWRQQGVYLRQLPSHSACDILANPLLRLLSVHIAILALPP